MERTTVSKLKKESNIQSESDKSVLKNNGFLNEQLENQDSLGELICRACDGSLGKKLDESRSAEYVVEHTPTKIDCNDSDGSS